MTPFRIFVSSPGDVSEERALAERVIVRLAREWPAVPVEPFLWEHEPLLATAAYQDQIDRICRPSDTDVVVCLLWCRFGTRLPKGLTRPDGSPYGSGTEYELEDAAAGYERSRTRPALLVYKKTAKLLVDIEDARYIDRKQQKDDLEAFLRAWTENPDGTPKRAMHRFETAADFEDLLERHLGKLLAARAQEMGERPKTAAVWRESPFRGLGVFDSKHAPIFFGRTAATSAVLAALRRRDERGEGFVAVVGASGSGKSSLARAGVLPLLMTPGVIPQVSIWRHAAFIPGERGLPLFEGLAAAILASDALPELAAADVTAKSLAATFCETPGVFVATLEGALRQVSASVQRERSLAEPPPARLALVLDQMEQLFTAEGATAADRQRFVQCLAAAVQARHLIVIATLRSDFFQRCQEIPELVALMQGDGQYQLQSPGPAELDRIITKPAMLAAIDFEPETESLLSLDRRLRDAALEQPHSLPLLEFALEQLYERRTPDGRLTHAAYDAIGELRGAVANHAESAFVGWTKSRVPNPPPDQVLGALLRLLVTIRPDTELITARRVPESEIPPGPLRDLANVLLKARLLVTDTDEGGQAVFTVAHEAVLREWPRARVAVAQDLEFLRIRARLALDRLRWEESHRDVKQRDRGLLLPEGRRLIEAEELLTKHRADLDQPTIGFIAASTARASSARRRRWSGYAVTALLLVGAGFGLYAFLQSQQIEQQRRLAVGYRLAAQAELTRAQDPTLSALLAVESLARGSGFTGDMALRRSLALLPELVSERQVEQVLAVSVPGTYVVEAGTQGIRVVNAVMNVAGPWVLKGVYGLSATQVTDDGRQIINVPTSSTSSGELRVIDATTGGAGVRIPTGAGDVSRASLSPDGRYVAATGQRTLRTWDIAPSSSATYHREMDWPGYPSALFSPDSTRLAVAGFGRVYLFEPTLAAEPRIIKVAGSSTTAAFRPGASHEIAISARNEVCLYSYVSEGPGSSCIPVDQEPSALAFSPDGGKLALVDRAGVVRVVDIATLAQLARFVTEEPPDSILWSASGALVAVRTPKSIAQVWHVEREREVARLTDVKQVLWFEPSGALAVWSESGLLRRWNLREGALEQRSLPHPTAAHDLSFTPDGKSLVTGSGYTGSEGTSNPDYNVRIWSLDQPRDPVVAPQSQAVGMVRALPDGRHLIVAGWHRVTIWDQQQGKETASLPCTSDFDDLQLTSLSLSWSANGRLLACHAASNTIQVYRLPDGQPVGKPLTGDDGVLGLAFDDEGQYLAMGRGKTIEMWDAAKSDITARIPVDVEEFYLQFIPRSRRLVLVGGAGARVFDLAKGTFEGEKFGREITARPMFSPDAKSIALPTENTVALWEIATRREIASFPHPNQVFNVAFSADGAFLATTSRDGAARIWEIATRRERVRLSDFLSRSSNLYQIAFSPDGKLIATQDSDVRLWKWHLDDLRAETCRLVRRNLTEAEWEEYVGAADKYVATCPALAPATGGSSAPAK